MKMVKIAVLMVFGFISNAEAGVFEASAGYAYQHNTYLGGSYTNTSSWNASFGYYFTQDSEVQFTYQDSSTQDYVPSVQDIQYHDQTYSLNFLYHFLHESTPVRPFLRLGVGQLNRDATGTYQGGYSPPGRLDEVTVIAGVGFKAKITTHFGLKAEATTYLLGGSVSTWQENLSYSFGGSFYF